MNPANSRFVFIRNDVQKQRDIARSLVSEAQALDATLAQLKGIDGAEDAVTSLTQRRARLLSLAKDLGANASSISSTAASVITDLGKVKA